MLNALAKRKRTAASGQTADRGLTSEEISREVTSFVTEKPTVIFLPNAGLSTGRGSIGEIAERSTRLVPTFLAGVILPTLMTLFYLLVFATPQFESEESFIVQMGTKSQRSITGVMALAAQLSGISTTSQETYMVLEYLRSTNAIDDIGGKAFLEPIYARDDTDYLSRMGTNLPLEDLQTYWESKIIPELDTRSGIITLKVRAFSAQDAYIISQKLMTLGEKLVNSVSLRSRQDTMTRVEGDLKRSVSLLADSRAALLQFRNQQNSVDPIQDAEHLASMLTELQLKRIELETKIGTMFTQMAPNSPAIKVKRQEADALQEQIDGIETKMTSMASGDNSVAKKLVEYEKLKTDLMYYEKLYTASMATYEQAREDTLKQQIFIIPVVSAAVAQSSEHPNIFQTTVAVFLLCLALWAIISLIIAAVKDHRI